MKKIITYLAFIIAMAGGIAGIVAICITAPRQNSDFDYLGFLVGILSMLVLFTVGWQIYTIIDSRSLRKDYEKLNKKLDLKFEDLAFSIYKSQAESFLAAGAFETALFHYLACLDFYDSAPFEAKEEIVDGLLEVKGYLTNNGSNNYKPHQLLISKEDKCEDIKNILKTNNQELIQWVTEFPINGERDPITGKSKEMPSSASH